jgi:hypothetical protein
MNGSTENRASDADEQLNPQQVVLNLGVARRMLPLLRRIAADILHEQRLLAQLGLEQETLDHQRQTLAWPQRQRRYEVHEEYAVARRHLEEALAELEVLGVTLIDAVTCQLGLPTVVNGKLAYFSWKPGEPTIQYWHFPGETERRLIPANWSESSTAPRKARK